MGALVSCIVPTKNRASFIPSVIECFQQQTYPHRELVILDHGSDDTPYLIPTQDNIRYCRIPDTNQTIGTMRNLCVAYARGDIIAHFDSDDWSAPQRLDDQVRRLKSNVLTGYSTVYFYDMHTTKSYFWQSDAMTFIIGTSFCYPRTWWAMNPFKDKRVGEDFLFLKDALRRYPGRVVKARSNNLMVARIHPQNTCAKKTTTSSRYKVIATEALPPAFLQTLCASTSSPI